MNKSIEGIKDCYGCGVCAIICPKKIISIRLNEDGFYEPQIVDAEKCINCGLCLNVCAFDKESVSILPEFDIKSYAAWSLDKQIRYYCSSGGIGFEVGSFLIQQGYKACGVKYNTEKKRAEHFIAATVEDFEASKGSKYIPSYTFNAFSKFNRKDKFFVVGTPCQIDSLRHYIRQQKIEDHFILMDFFCHGVPSMLMWKKYIEVVEKKLNKELDNIHWRCKKMGWHNSYAMTVENDSKSNFDYFSLMSKGDLFYKFFLGNRCLGKACYDKCKYKMLSSAADIRIGDLWGSVYQKNEEGVSGVIVLTMQGQQVIDNISRKIYLEKKNPNIVLEGQMKQAAGCPSNINLIRKQMKGQLSLERIDFFLFLDYVVKNMLQIMKNRFKRIFK